MKVRDGQIVGKFGRLVNPEQPITEGASGVHGISESEVKDAPTPKELLSELLEFIGNDMLVAHNGFDFDFDFVAPASPMRGGTCRIARYAAIGAAAVPRQLASVDALMTRSGIQDILRAASGVG